MEAREGIVLIDFLTGQIIDANPEFQRQAGRTLEELQKLKIWEIRPKEIQDKAKMKFNEIKYKGIGQSDELSFQQKDGKIIPIEFLSREITVYGKRMLQSITRDISERKKYEEELLEKQELLKKQRDELEAYASIAAHDIRGKLQVISLYNEMLNDSLFSEKITEQINDMVDFLNNLLLLSKQGEIIGETIEIDLNQLVKEISSKIKTINPSLTINISKLPKIKGDYQKLHQVFENLLMNIVKHAKASKVEIYSVSSKDKLQIYLKDNGIGMNKETQKRIQNAWQTKKYTTLGLMIVKKIIEAHNGILEFQTEEGKGTIFILNFLKNHENLIK